MGEGEWGAEVLAQVDPVLFWDGREDFDDFGVELGAGAAANFFVGVGPGPATRADGLLRDSDLCFDGRDWIPHHRLGPHLQRTSSFIPKPRK